MSIPHLGRGTWIGWGKETTWGTAVSRTHWAQAISASLNRAIRYETLPHLVHGDDAVVQDTYVSGEEAGGDVELVGRYGALGYWIEAAMGAVSTSGTAAPYTHTFSTDDALPSLTIEQLLGSSGNSEVFSGCKVGRLGLSLDPGGFLRVKPSVIAKPGAAIGAAGTPTAPTAAIVLHRHAGDLTHNGVTYPLAGFELDLDNQLDRLRELGSGLTSEPPISNFRSWLIKAKIAYRTDGLYTAHLAKTAASGSLAMTSGTMSLTINYVNAIVRAYSRPFTSAGVVYQDVEILPRSSGSTDALTIELVNSEANYYD